MGFDFLPDDIINGGPKKSSRRSDAEDLEKERLFGGAIDKLDEFKKIKESDPKSLGEIGTMVAELSQRAKEDVIGKFNDKMVAIQKEYVEEKGLEALDPVITTAIEQAAAEVLDSVEAELEVYRVVVGAPVVYMAAGETFNTIFNSYATGRVNDRNEAAAAMTAVLTLEAYRVTVERHAVASVLFPYLKTPLMELHERTQAEKTAAK